MASALGQYHIGGGLVAAQMAGVAPTTQLLDTAPDKIGCIFIAPDDSQDITKIGVYCTAVADDGGLDNLYQVVIEGYNAAGGIPDGADVGGGSPTLTTFTPAAATYHEITLTNSFTPTEGTAYAVVLEAAGVPDGADNGTFVRNTDSDPGRGSPYGVTDSTGSWAKISTEAPTISPIFADGLIVPGTEIMTAADGTAWGSGSTPDEKGNLWTPDDTATCIGFVAYGRWATAAANFDIILYDTDGSSVLASISYDGEMVSNTGGLKRRIGFWEGVSVTAASNYRLVAKPTTASTIRVYGGTFANSAHRESFAGKLQATTRVDAGGWTQDATSLRAIYPILSDITAGGGSRAIMI